MTIGEGHRQRLKERFKQAGPKAFAEHELLELLLTFALPRKDTKSIAKSLLHEFGSLSGVLKTDLERLSNEKGLGEHSAILLKLIEGISRYYQNESKLKGVSIRSPLDVLEFVQPLLAPLKEEKFLILLVNQENKILELYELEHGIENRVQVYIKKIVRRCLDHHATGLICAHNHPSGSSSFSDSDIQLTRALDLALSPLEIRLMDHLLICGQDFRSMQAEGLGPFDR